MLIYWLSLLWWIPENWARLDRSEGVCSAKICWELEGVDEHHCSGNFTFEYIKKDLESTMIGNILHNIMLTD